ncbi:MAG: carboxypeptidase regulatory-like domain-containing protein [Planctomycetes bacterium]|nr:carboxypeptidase regulatory-like domain-containing protein [Planctomycetota bacterium]
MRGVAVGLFVLVLAIALLVLRPWHELTTTPSPSPAPTPLPAAAVAAQRDEPTAAERIAVDAAPAAATTPAAPPVPTGTLQVWVRSERGTAVPGCRVTVGGIEQTTDPLGEVRFETATGRVFVAATPSTDTGLARQGGWQTVSADAVAEVVLVLPAATVLPFWCQLVAAEDQRPLAGIEVRRVGDDARWRSDAEGYAHVALLDEQSCLEVTTSGRSPRRIVPEEGHATRTTALRVPLAAGCAVQLRAVDAAGAPVGDVVVRITAAAWRLQWPEGQPARGKPIVWQATTDAGGAARLGDLPIDQALDVEVQAPPGFATPEPTRWTFAAVTAQQTITLSAGAGVRGVVLDAAARPVAGVAVQANAATAATLPRVLDVASPARTTQTGTDGTFRLDGLPPGPWWIGTERDDAHAPAVVAVAVTAGQTTDVTLRVHGGKPLAGTAVDADGRPCAGVTIDLRIDEQYVAGTKTDAAGRFRFAALPDGACELATDPYEGELALPEPLAATAGDEQVVLRLSALRGTLHGHLRGGRGWVALLQRSGSGMIATRCDLDGTFRYTGLDPGIWDVRGETADGAVAWQPGVTIVAGRDTGPIDLTLAAGAKLRPRHPTADEFVVCRGDDVVAVDNLVAGASGETRVPPGAWTVVFRTRGKETTRREVTVAAGDDRAVAVE